MPGSAAVSFFFLVQMDVDYQIVLLHMGENVEARIAGTRQRFYERHLVVLAPHENIADSPKKTRRIFPEIINFYPHVGPPGIELGLHAPEACVIPLYHGPKNPICKLFDCRLQNNFLFYFSKQSNYFIIFSQFVHYFNYIIRHRRQFRLFGNKHFHSFAVRLFFKIFG